MKRKLATILALSSAIIIYGGYYFGLPYVLNKPTIKNIIEQKTLQATGYKTELVNPNFKTGIIPSLKLSADEFNILNNDTSKALEIKSPYVQIKLFPLFFKNIEISKFDAETLTVNLIFDKNSKFRLGQYLIEQKPNNQININKAVINLNQYTVNLHDEIQNKIIRLKGDYFNLTEFSSCD